jgi:hypothetical protein
MQQTGVAGVQTRANTYNKMRAKPGLPILFTRYAAAYNHDAEKSSSNVGKLRLTAAVSAFDCLGLVPAMQRAAFRQDPRSLLEASAAILNAAGAMKGMRASVYESLLYKEVGEIGGKYQSGVKAVSTRKLINLKMNAAYWVSAGTTVGVVLDAFDAYQAGVYGDDNLKWAYVARTGLGAGTIGLTLYGATFETAPLWITRLNIYLALGTLVVSETIGRIKGKPWEQWLQRQPFHKTDSHKVPYDNERTQMLDLGEVVEDLTPVN